MNRSSAQRVIPFLATAALGAAVLSGTASAQTLSGSAAAGSAGGSAAAGSAAQSGTASTYLVVYAQGASSSHVATDVAAANGELVMSYPQIGVAVARSASASFASAMRSVGGVSQVSATNGFATRLDPATVGTAGAAADATTVNAAPTGGPDPLSGLQWDMNQISAPQAHAITGGSPSVIVGDIDTGLDYTHPDLAPNVDFSRSVSCVGGVPNTDPAAWMDDNGHGTHTAGTIAAAANGIGIVGVAPNVRLAGIKAGNADGFFYPEAVVCSFMWAAEHGIQVTNNSYFADPWLFNCKNDPEQRAIWTAERRAISYAQSKGVLVVAAEGNQSDDLAHPTQDATSPDNTTPVTRDITNACAVVPVEVPGVVGVSATGDLRMKSFYSSYGVGSVDVAAPGGDSRLQLTAAAPNGRVLSTYPASLASTCARKVIDPSGAVYCYLQGTSMASPHAAGVAALIASERGLRSGALAAALQRATDNIACPTDVSAYAPYPATDGGAPQTCIGGLGNNSWFGSGQINALTAVK